MIDALNDWTYERRHEHKILYTKIKKKKHIVFVILKSYSKRYAELSQNNKETFLGFPRAQ